MAAKRDVARVLRKALKLMNNEGAHWVKGSFQVRDRKTGEYKYCSAGAISKAAGLYEVDRDYGSDEKLIELRDAALDELATGLKSPGWTKEAQARDKITNWNDQSRRTWNDIVKRFNKTIDRVEGKK